MKKYIVWYKSEIVSYYEIDAESADEATAMAEARCDSGEPFDGEGEAADFEYMETCDTSGEAFENE